MADFWQSNQTVVEIQEGGPGNLIKLLDPSAQVSGPSGGLAPVADRFVRDFKAGAGAYKREGVALDGDPERITFDLMTRWRAAEFLKTLRAKGCQHNLHVRWHCGAVDDPLNYNNVMLYTQVFGVGRNLDNNIASGITAQAPDVMEVVNESASDEVRIRPVQHLDISGTVSDFALNEVISVGNFNCPGDCDPLLNDGNQDYWAVGDVDTTPGYAGAGAPNFFYTTDGGTTWTADAITVFLSGNAVDVIRVAGNVLVAGPTNGVAIAKFQDIKDSVSNHWSLATGLTTPYPNALFYAGGGVVWAAGNTGRIWKSTDGGLSFTLISNGVQTTQNLNEIYFASDTLGWFVGNGGAIVKYLNGALSLVTVSGLTANLNTVVVPDDRTKEVYIGTAGGHVYRSRDTGKTFTQMPFPASGTGSVRKLAFSGPQGCHLWVVQHNVAGNKSRVLRDRSGGALSFCTEPIGSFDSPANSLINAIAPSDPNTAVTVGELDGPSAFIGRIA